MKHIKTFESFDHVDEYFGQEFLTGHKPGEKENAKARIMSEINDAIEKMMEDPDSYAQSDDAEQLEQDLTIQARENKYRGTIETKESPANGLLYIVYRPTNTPLQNLGAGAGAVTGTKIMGGY
jgi:hypothetical protein